MARYDRPLYSAEEKAVANAVEARRREFAAGRACSREALADLGEPGGVLPRAEDGRPMWPEGVTGSIAHTRSHCVAVAARQAEVRAVGVDLEISETLEQPLWRRICTPREHAWVLEHTSSERLRGILVTLLFSSKEAVYKCVYPEIRRFLDFDDVEIQLDPVTGRFSPRVRTKTAELPGRVHGRAGCLNGVIVAGAWCW